mmetsp:Transcript_6614/g.10634  ORF Transcript_6614/g.10634 Transcript_6614/m.10634 type:complete len:104 (-) Transcript_6614:603-914(-)
MGNVYFYKYRLRSFTPSEASDQEEEADEQVGYSHKDQLGQRRSFYMYPEITIGKWPLLLSTIPLVLIAVFAIWIQVAGYLRMDMLSFLKFKLLGYLFVVVGLY